MIPVGMIPVDPEGRRRAPNRAVPVDPERLVVPNPVARLDPGNREATDLSLGRALLGRMPMRLHLTAAHPLLMPALPHPTLADRRTPVHRRRDPTTRAVATCLAAARAEATPAVAIPAEATRAVAVRRAEATRRAGPTDGGAEPSRRADRKPVYPLTARMRICEFALHITLFVSPSVCWVAARV